MSKPVLKLDWCSHEAATFAVMHWHYSKAMPKSKLAKVGVWEDGKFIHPHDACWDQDGNIFVVEWVPTGRVTKLRKV